MQPIKGSLVDGWQLTVLWHDYMLFDECLVKLAHGQLGQHTDV